MCDEMVGKKLYYYMYKTISLMTQSPNVCDVLLHSFNFIIQENLIYASF